METRVMRIALCSTTIHTPRVLKLMRKCSADVRFFVAVDEKTPGEANRFIDEIDAARHFFHGDGNWKCSDAIGFNTLARRNIAFLEALKWGADVIYSWDDDNLPLNLDHFDRIEMVMGGTFDGFLASSASQWFDAGQMLNPWAKHRGIPHGRHPHVYDFVTGAKVGVAAGLVLGDPDIDATTRLERAPDIHNVSELAKSGVVVAHDTHTVFNSQNTAVLREFVPSWFMFPDCGRYDDMYASIVVKRVMRERNYHVHFGRPFCWQQRNEHSATKDLRAEIEGMERIQAFAELLDRTPLKGKSVIEDTRTIYNVLALTGWFPKRAIQAGLAWLEDCEQVL